MPFYNKGVPSKYPIDAPKASVVPQEVNYHSTEHTFSFMSR